MKEFRNLICVSVLCLMVFTCASVDDDPSTSSGQAPTEDDDTTADDTIADGSDDTGDDDAGRYGLPGWHILATEYEEPNDIDGMSFEWDYFMIHDETAEFTGSVGYLIANPRNREDLFGSLVPKGGNVAIAGSFPDGSNVAEYRNFQYENFTAGKDIRQFNARNDESGQYGSMTPVEEENALLLEGQTERFEWNLHVSQDWSELSGGSVTYVPEHGTNMGLLRPEEEQWNVDMLWPATRVTGTILNRETEETLDIDGRGYRENSWGRWAFNLGGWDFAVATDKDNGVNWAWQTYHYESTQLDYLDLGFELDGELKLEHFRAADGELGWRHDHWTFDTEARQCVWTDASVVAQNDRWRIEATVDNGADGHVPMLSDATIATQGFVIFILFPHVTGSVIDRETGETVAEFSALGGGEFSVARTNADSMTEEECATWGATFASPIPD